MNLSAKMINLGMKKAYDYLEKDPENNLPKLVDLLDKVLPKDLYTSQRDAIRQVLNEPDGNWMQLVRSL